MSSPWTIALTTSMPLTTSPKTVQVAVEVGAVGQGDVPLASRSVWGPELARPTAPAWSWLRPATISLGIW